jgi:hypothetical protein
MAPQWASLQIRTSRTYTDTVLYDSWSSVIPLDINCSSMVEPTKNKDSTWRILFGNTICRGCCGTNLSGNQ